LSGQFGKCVICDDVCDDDVGVLRCDECHCFMHSVCWDPDVTTDVCDYISNCRSKDARGLRIYCVTCTADIVRLKDLDSRLLAVEASISSILANYNITSSAAVAVNGAASHESINVSAANASIPPTVVSQSSTVQDEIAEALEKERRKANLVIFNIAAVATSDFDAMKSLIKDLTDDAAPSFSCNRLGSGPNKPLLVQFQNEKDKHFILKNAHKLRQLSTKWPKVSIAPDRTKREQAAFKQLRTECKMRQSRGERVIIWNSKIVPDKRTSSMDLKQSAPHVQNDRNAALSFSSCDPPLLVDLPPLKSQTSSSN
jgi:hypothetical protein